jgi:hypothetical protein
VITKLGKVTVQIHVDEQSGRRSVVTLDLEGDFPDRVDRMVGYISDGTGIMPLDEEAVKRGLTEFAKVVLMMLKFNPK